MDLTSKTFQGNDKIKLSISGEYEEFKTFKKTLKYKELVSAGVMVTFVKPKKDESKKEFYSQGNEEESEGGCYDFHNILRDLILQEKDSSLYQSYESIVNGVEVGDVLIVEV